MSDESQTGEPKRRGRKPGPDRQAREDREEVRAETERRERIPLGTPLPKMNAKVPDGMVGRWFNDTPGRIEAALQAGYEFINDQGGEDSRESARCINVGVNEDGSPMVAYLMAIPEEWYSEDQGKKQRPIDEFEAAIKRGIPQGAGQDEPGNFYDAGTSIKHG